MKMNKLNLKSIQEGVFRNVLPKYFDEYEWDYGTNIFMDIWDIVLDDEQLRDILNRGYLNKFEDEMENYRMEITGNDCGSHYCNRLKAQEMCCKNWDFVLEAVKEFYGENTSLKLFEEWESLDVIAREYAFDSVVQRFSNVWKEYVEPMFD